MAKKPGVSSTPVAPEDKPVTQGSDTDSAQGESEASAAPEVVNTPIAPAPGKVVLARFRYVPGYVIAAGKTEVVFDENGVCECTDEAQRRAVITHRVETGHITQITDTEGTKN